MPRVPLRTEHVVSPGLDLDVYVVPFDARQGPLHAWVFASRGLSKMHHREIVFAVKMRPGEAEGDHPADVSGFFRAVFGAAAQGHTVDIGDRTTFESVPTTVFGRADVGGVVYTWVPPSLADITGTDALLAVALTRQEMAIAYEFGLTRVLARLGESVRHYPTPPWMDRDRKDVLRREEMAASLIGQVSRLRLSRTAAFMTRRDTARKVVPTTAAMPDFEGTWSDGPVTLLLDGADAARLKAALTQFPPDAHFAVMTHVSPSIPHCMVFMPEAVAAGQAVMISDCEKRWDPRHTGNFIVFAGGQEASLVRCVEDGFVLWLTDADLGRVRRALTAGEALSIDDAGGSLLLEIRPAR